MPENTRVRVRRERPSALAWALALLVTMLCATYGKKMVRLIPFILGILAGSI